MVKRVNISLFDDELAILTHFQSLHRPHNFQLSKGECIRLLLTIAFAIIKSDPTILQTPDITQKTNDDQT